MSKQEELFEWVVTASGGCSWRAFDCQAQGAGPKGHCARHTAFIAKILRDCAPKSTDKTGVNRFPGWVCQGPLWGERFVTHYGRRPPCKRKAEFGMYDGTGWCAKHLAEDLDVEVSELASLLELGTSDGDL